MANALNYADPIDVDKVDPSFFMTEVPPLPEDKNTRAHECDKAESDPAIKDKTAVTAYMSKYAKESGYYNSLAKFENIKRKEEVKLFSRYTFLRSKVKKSQNPTSKLMSQHTREANKIKEMIIHRNLRYVVKVATGFWRDSRPDTLENLISAGNIGLIRAVDKFDLKIGTRFLTYATHWIALEIHNELAETNIMSIPLWWRRTIININKAYIKLSKGDNRVGIPIEDIAIESQVPIKKIIKHLTKDSNVLKSVHIPLKNPFSVYNEEYTPSPINDLQRVDDAFEKGSIRNKVHAAVAKLNDKERLIVEQRFGLTGDEPKNLRQMANIIGVSSERVRQLQLQGTNAIKEWLLDSTDFGGLDTVELEDILCGN